jgi:hypothetical protein
MHKKIMECAVVQILTIARESFLHEAVPKPLSWSREFTKAHSLPTKDQCCWWGGSMFVGYSAASLLDLEVLVSIVC